MKAATARACANIALVKYWGKRPGDLNLPATGSLSLTLEALATETTVVFDPKLSADQFELNGQISDTPKITAFLDVVRGLANVSTRAAVTSWNEFPTASGLASSASGFAALVVAATSALGIVLPPHSLGGSAAHPGGAGAIVLPPHSLGGSAAHPGGAGAIVLDPTALSRLARRGSGSAARSIFGGFVRMHAGETDAEAYACPIASTLVDSVRMAIAIVGGGVRKQHGSRDAMNHVAQTSPYYPGWLSLVPHDLAPAEAALAAGDIAALGEVAEHNALAMHATALAARPPIHYWQPATLAALAAVRQLRSEGRAAWATMDAGPHVKVLTTVDDAAYVERELARVDGVTATMVSKPGPGAKVVP